MNVDVNIEEPDDSSLLLNVLKVNILSDYYFIIVIKQYKFELVGEVLNLNVTHQELTTISNTLALEMINYMHMQYFHCLNNIN